MRYSKDSDLPFDFNKYSVLKYLDTFVLMSSYYTVETIMIQMWPFPSLHLS